MVQLLDASTSLNRIQVNRSGSTVLKVDAEDEGVSLPMEFIGLYALAAWGFASGALDVALKVLGVWALWLAIRLLRRKLSG